MADKDDMLDAVDAHEIALLAIAGENYYLLKGEAHLNQMLLADGKHPVPICCLAFDNVLDVALTLGKDVSLANSWTIHPEIVARLRRNDMLIELRA